MNDYVDQEYCAPSGKEKYMTLTQQVQKQNYVDIDIQKSYSARKEEMNHTQRDGTRS